MSVPRKTLASVCLGLRSFLFLGSFFLSTALFASLGCWILLLPERYVFVYARQLSKTIVFFLKYLMGITTCIEGQENIPPGPAIIAMRHESTWETMVLFVYIERLCFVIKQELLYIPFVRSFLMKLGSIAVKRWQKGSSVRALVAQGRERLAQGYKILIFPEGTRMAPGVFLPFQRGLGFLYENMKVPVIPAVLNSGRHWPRRRFYKYPGTITIRFLPAIPPGMSHERFLEHFTQVFMEAYRDLEEREAA
ncbi:MAG: 1-acyl-sn-glycerol-3-phosphate acyltransferase [Holosporales bacterium]|nr:1-acyl-sn-glycerol-3-phosphate acyltransferase [Holosporales bacterium]